jgi:hypothetical protein
MANADALDPERVARVSSALTDPANDGSDHFL